MSSKKKSKKPEVRREFALVRHDYSRDETDQIIKSLTEGIGAMSELAEQKKAVTAEFTAKMKTQAARNQEAVNKLNAGYCMLETDCEVVMDYEHRMKRYYPLRDTGKRGAMAKEEPMSEVDMQAQLALNVLPKQPKKPTKADKPADSGAVPEPVAEVKTPKKRGRKVKPGDGLVAVADAVDAARPASHKLTPVRGEMIVDDDPLGINTDNDREQNAD